MRSRSPYGVYSRAAGLLRQRCEVHPTVNPIWRQLSIYTFLQAKTSSIIPRGNIGLRFQGIEIYQVMTG